MTKKAKGLMAGFGSVAQALWPLMESMGWKASEVMVIDASESAVEKARAMGIQAERLRVEESMGAGWIKERLEPGGALINLTVGVSSSALIEAARELGAIYVDAGIEEWESQARKGRPWTTNEERNRLLERIPKRAGEPTAMVGFGANPGLASSWVRRALRLWAAEAGEKQRDLAETGRWGKLARELDARLIQCAEKDWGRIKRDPSWGRGCGVNSWSVEGLVTEALQRGESGWGSHEGEPPPGWEIQEGEGGVQVAMMGESGAAMRVRSWTPMGGRGIGRPITHLESIGISRMLTDEESGWRPTAHYAYQVGMEASSLLDRALKGEWKTGDESHVAGPSMIEGVNELGMLICSPRMGSIWVGSRLSSEEARERVASSQATTLQVAAGLAAALKIAMESPRLGLMEPEDVDDERLLKEAARWIGDPVASRSRRVEIFGEGSPVDLSWRGWLVRK